jgi:hypothetical protein
MRRLIFALLLCPFIALAADRQIINVGSYPGDGTGDSPRAAFNKANANFQELFSRLDTLGTNPLAKLFLPVNVKDATYGAKGDNVTDDRAAIQAAIDVVAAAGGGTVYFPPSTGYYVDGTLTNSHSNVVFDFGGNVMRGNVNTPLLKLIPQSLIDSGRYDGTDYPAAWLKAGIPTPVDGDKGTMMHEHLTGSRLKNVALLNARFATDANFLYAYSTDDLVIRNCHLNAANNSAFRAYNCDRVLVDRNTFEGGAGSYTVFFFKSRNVLFTGNFVNSTGVRCLSFKGALHKDGVSIFEDLAESDFENAEIIVSHNRFNFIHDGVFFDWPPDSADDCGDAFSHTVGFSKALWYGRFRGIIVNNNQFCFIGTPAPGAGRWCWASYPHENISVRDNISIDSGVFFAGVKGAVVSGNQQHWTQTSANAAFVQDDTTTANVSQYVSITGNHYFNYFPANTGSGTDPEAIYVDGYRHDVTDNRFYGIGATNLPNAIVLGPILDYSRIERNKGWADSAFVIVPNPVLTVFGGTNNLHGITSDNDFFDLSGSNSKVGGLEIFDTGSGTAATIIRTGRYGGFAIKDTDKATFLAQFFYDTNGLKTVIQHRDAPALTFEGASGNAKFKNWFTLPETSHPSSQGADTTAVYAADDGTGTRVYSRTSSGTNKLAHANGDTFNGRVKVVDQGDGASLQVLVSDDSTGFGGIAIRNAADNATRYQAYYDAANADFKEHVAGNLVRRVDNTGVAYFSGGVIATNSYYLFSPNNTRWHIKVANDGTLSAVAE